MILGAAALLTACDVKDPIYDSEPTTGGTVTLVANWNDKDGNIEKPSSWNIFFGDYTKVASADRHEITTPLPAGDYTAYLYNEVPTIPIAGYIATVKTVTTPDGETGTYLEPQPGWLFTGLQKATVEDGGQHEFTVSMHQQVRELTLVIDPQGNTADRIDKITASLSGAAGSLDVESGTHGSPSNVALLFDKITTGEYAGKWSATVRLLGVTGNEQKLTGTIVFNDNNLADIPLESDLSTDLARFNEEKKSPVRLDGQTDIPSQAGFTATINGWTKVTGGTGIAN